MMSNRSRQIAWTPLKDPRKTRLVAIRCHPDQVLDRDIYLFLLSKRIQQMVDAAPDAAQAVSALQEEMFRTGVVLEVGHCPAAEAGNRLVWSNPAVAEKISCLRVFQKLRKVKLPLVENLMAHQALSSEMDDPEGGLTRWAWLIGEVP
jgi:hypothetical protein